MASRKFGEQVRQAREEKGWSQSELGRQLFGKFPVSHRVFDAAGVARIERGGPVKVDRELVQAHVEVLVPHLDPTEAWLAAGLVPPELTPEVYRRFLEFLADQGEQATARNPEPAGHRPWTRPRPSPRPRARPRTRERAA